MIFLRHFATLRLSYQQEPQRAVLSTERALGSRGDGWAGQREAQGCWLPSSGAGWGREVGAKMDGLGPQRKRSRAGLSWGRLLGQVFLWGSCLIDNCPRVVIADHPRFGLRTTQHCASVTVVATNVPMTG